MTSWLEPTVTASTMIAQVMGCGQGWMSQRVVDFRRGQPIPADTASPLLFRSRKLGNVPWTAPDFCPRFFPIFLRVLTFLVRVL